MPEQENKRENECQDGDQNETKKKAKLEDLKSDQETVGLNQKIQKQIEYYFSDVNVIKDNFLKEEFKKDDGWVKLSVLLTFVRLQKLSKDEDRILEAFKDFTSDVIEVDSEKKAIRRKKPIPSAEDYVKELESRTIHISGFPTNYEFEDLHQFCNQFGEVESMPMRRYFKTRLFKGCVHCVYKSEESVKKILAMDVLKCKDRELRTEAMNDYHKRKLEFKQSRGKKAKETGPSGTTINL